MPGSVDYSMGWAQAGALATGSTEDPSEVLEVLEARWWYLHPGQPGYDKPLHEYCGFTEAEWRQLRMRQVRR